MSERTSLYRLYAADDTLLYAGISKQFGDRWLQHARAKPWWGDVDHQTITWYKTRAEADAAETAAIAAERPVYNIAKSSHAKPARRPRRAPRLKREDWDAPMPLPTPTRFTTVRLAELAQTTRHTVEREIRRGNLAAEKIGRTWVIDQAEAGRWAAQFTPYAGLRKDGETPAS